MQVVETRGSTAKDLPKTRQASATFASPTETYLSRYLPTNLQYKINYLQAIYLPLFIQIKQTPPTLH